MNRAFGRNVHIYDASDPTKNLGGLIQNGSITQSNFLFIISILIACDKPYDVVERATSLVVAHNDNPINHGDYDIRSAGDIRVTDEPWVKRVLTFAVSGEDMFRTAVRERDGKCVFTGIVNQRAPAGEWSGFAVAHIFPLSAEAYWNQNDFECCVSVVPPHEPGINSPQNGFVALAHLHQEWDNYLMSVNPDDNYKIVVFDSDIFGVDGKTLDPVCRNQADPLHVPDQLLRWHYRQSVLANVRGAGEPVFEHDFPPGTDMVGEILAGPYGKERFEIELQNRLSSTIATNKE